MRSSTASGSRFSTNAATASLDQVGIGAGEAGDAILVHGAPAATSPKP